MRTVRFTKDEVLMIQGALAGEVNPPKSEKIRLRVLAKLAEAEGQKTAGVNAAAFESALIAASHGKIVPVESNSYARVSRQATQAGATVAAAGLVGAWVATQTWLRGPLTVFTVLNKWPDWLARAKVTAPPDGIEAGIGAGDVGSSPGQKRPASAAGRRAPGIG